MAAPSRRPARRRARGVPVLAGLAGVVLLAAAPDALGEDVAIAGHRVAVRTGTKRLVRFVTRAEPAIVLRHDPRTVPTAVVFQGEGAVLGSTGIIDLDPARWVAIGKRWRKGYRYRDPDGARGGITAVTLRRGRLDIVARSERWTWRPAGAADAVWVRFGISDTQYCARFGGRITRNRGGEFAAVGAPRPAACPAWERVEADGFSAVIFASPPREFGPQARWWWPGGAVDDVTIGRHLQALAGAGYGAVEIQPVALGVTHADLAADPTVRTVGDPAFREHLRSAGCAARALGLAWDMTLGSGWPSGAPDIDGEAERQLLLATRTVHGPMRFADRLPAPEPPDWIAVNNAILPAIDGFDGAVSLVAAVAAEVLDDTVSPPRLGPGLDLTPLVSGDTLAWDVPAGTYALLAAYANRTAHFPLGAAYPGAREAARVIDHLDRAGIDAVLARQVTPWLASVAACPPRSVFVDSFELVGELPWTTAFAARFRTTFGYALEPFLPFLFRKGGENEYVKLLAGLGPPRYETVDGTGRRAREDYERLRAMLFGEEFVTRLVEWAHGNGVQVRLQAHGGWGDLLDAYGLADVPESEGLFGGGSYDFLKLAASAAHVAGRRWASSETFVTLSPAGSGRLSLDEMWLLMGRAFSAGINRVVHHGTAYPYAHANGARWFPFDPIAGNASPIAPVPFTFDLHPDAGIWPAMAGFNRAAARLSYALSRGSHVAEVAWLMPAREAHNFPNFRDQAVAPAAHESALSRALRRAGYTYDRVSVAGLAGSRAADGWLRVGQATYRAVLVEGLGTADPALLQAIHAAAASSVPVAWLGDLPQRAPGLQDAPARDALVQSLAGDLAAAVDVVPNEADVPGALARAGVLPPVSPVDLEGLAVSVEHRRLDGEDLYLLFNESYEPRTARLRMTARLDDAWLFDPETGVATRPDSAGDVLTVVVPAARGRVLWLRQ